MPTDPIKPLADALEPLGTFNRAALERELRKAFELGVEAERERCAQIAENAHVISIKFDDYCRELPAGCHEYTYDRDIAAAIRNPEHEDTNHDQ